VFTAFWNNESKKPCSFTQVTQLISGALAMYNANSRQMHTQIYKSPAALSPGTGIRQKQQKPTPPLARGLMERHKEQVLNAKFQPCTVHSIRCTKKEQSIKFTALLSWKP
jgi:hypothetical protein